MIGLVIVVIALLIFNIGWAKEGQECIKNPMVYGAQKIYDQNNELEVFCSCTLLDPRYNSFYFNKEKVWQDEVFSYINLSEILVTEN